ncbi:MAG: TIGR00730 family Rossman fold protein [Phycisphaerales bacterium]|nr:TIGR00730 family Rossman fold protein [Phycisphaerales bacterium]
MQALTVYCASSTALDPRFADSARALGRGLAQRDMALVYGGGSTGLMGEVAEATKDAGGTVVGIITEYLHDREVAFTRCDELVVVDTMRERKRRMAERGDGFIVLPGGLGTYEEFFEALVGRVLDEHRKPIGIVNDHGYFDPMMTMIEHGINERFIRPAIRELLLIDENPITVLDMLANYQSPEFGAKDLIPPLASSRDGDA